jgi:phosphoglucomutase
MELLNKVQQGFAGINADPALKEKALQILGNWLKEDDFLSYRPQIEWLISEGKWSELMDAFYQVLPFGTGGRRGAVGIGPNRMNLWTLGASVQGHSEYLKARFAGSSKPLHVAVAYDVRQFEDKRKVYNPALPNPILHLSSRNFCEYAARIYAANGIITYILPPDSKKFLSTPELSYTIRYLQCHGGLNISASHNPPDDNGGKFYDERGGQPIAPEDQLMSEFVDQVTTIRSLAWNDAVKSGKVIYLDEGPHNAYIEMTRRQALLPAPRFDEFRLVFTPLHGVGSQSAMEALQADGFRPIPVESQMAPDGQFPNVTKTPNPEVQECLDKAIEVGLEHKAHLILATDPDADRLGGLVNRDKDGQGEFRFVTGNEIAALLTHFKLQQLQKQGSLPPSPIVVRTEVTTSLVSKVARHFGAQVVENLMVGFKYIAEVIWQLESKGAYEDVLGAPTDFIIGAEESHGVLTTPLIRDKDAAGGALLMAEMALEQKRQGRSVVAYLDEIFREFGYHRNEVVNIVMTGIEGKTNMTKMLETLRKNPPQEIAGLKVSSFEDLRDENGRLGALKGATDALSRNFLIFRLGSGEAKVTLRPSGTEPKAKAYIEVSSAPFTVGSAESDWVKICKDVDDLTQKLATEFLATALATVGQTPAPGADKLSR